MGEEYKLIFTMPFLRIFRIREGFLMVLVLFAVVSIRVLKEQTNNHLQRRVLDIEQPRIHTSKPKMTVSFEGRLGNNMFEYAALLSTADKNNYEVVLPETLSSDLYQIFPNIDEKPKIRWESAMNNYIHVTESSYPSIGFYDARLEKLTNYTATGARHNILLNGTFQSFKYFRKNEETIRNQFEFSSNVRKKALRFLRSLPSSAGDARIQNVGIHIRRGDFLWGYYKDLGYVVAQRTYFLKAMNFMRRIHGSVRFIIASNDIPWAKENLGQNDVFYSPFTDTGTDLALLAHCDHVIVSVGSFGWWAAWLANGTTVYFDKFPLPGSVLGGQFRKEDYYMPHWFAMN